MALPPGKRGAFGDWLKTQRERRYRTQADALAAYRKLAGLSIAPSEYAMWESGSRTPGAKNAKRLALYEFYGSREEQPEQPSAPAAETEISALVTAVANLTAQNAALTARLAEHVEATTRLARDQVTTQEYLAAVLSVMAQFQSPAGFDTATAIRAAADDLQARRLATGVPG